MVNSTAHYDVVMIAIVAHSLLGVVGKSESLLRLLVIPVILAAPDVFVSLVIVEVLLDLVEFVSVKRLARLPVLLPLCSRFKSGAISCHRLSTSRRSSSADAFTSSNPSKKCAARMKLRVPAPMRFLTAL